MGRIKCTKCKKHFNDKAKSCPYCGEMLDDVKAKKPKKWYERTSVTLCVAALIIVVGLGFIHIITGVVSPYNLPVDVALKKSFGYRETFVNAEKITAIPYVAAKTKYPLGCEVLQRLGYVESGNVFETAMVEQLRDAIKTWQMEFEETLNKPSEQWQEKLRGKTVTPEDNASSAESYNNRGINAAIKGRYETAISEFNRALRKNPAYADAYYNRGLVYITIGQLGQAISDFTQTIEINPECTDAYTHRANINVTMNQYDEAIADYTSVLELDSKCPEIRFRRALVSFAKGYYDKAWEDVRMIQRQGLDVPKGFFKSLRRASKAK